MPRISTCASRVISSSHASTSATQVRPLREQIASVQRRCGDHARIALVELRAEVEPFLVVGNAGRQFTADRKVAAPRAPAEIHPDAQLLRGVEREERPARRFEPRRQRTIDTVPDYIEETGVATRRADLLRDTRRSRTDPWTSGATSMIGSSVTRPYCAASQSPMRWPSRLMIMLPAGIPCGDANVIAPLNASPPCRVISPWPGHRWVCARSPSTSPSRRRRGSRCACTSCSRRRAVATTSSAIQCSTRARHRGHSLHRHGRRHLPQITCLPPPRPAADATSVSASANPQIFRMTLSPLLSASRIYLHRVCIVESRVHPHSDYTHRAESI